jgi:signal transduction histidine kinase
MELSGGNIPAKIPAIEKRLAGLEDLLRELLETRHEHLNFFRGILETIEMARVRLNELREDRLKWRQIAPKEFRIILNQFLSATERVGRGKFRFIYPPEEPCPDSYRIDFQIKPGNGHLEAPLILHDTIRDLVGNARKYSMPGTRISISLEEIEPKGIRLSVSDQGIGIPAGEIEKVVEFGYRATNAMDRNTMGGGFGLTKAYLLSRKFNGRFFIESAEGKGTTIELFLYPLS